MSIYKFINENHNSSGLIGRICKSILYDSEYPAQKNDFEQVAYLIRNKAWCENLREPIIELLSAYSKSTYYLEQNIRIRKPNMKFPKNFVIDGVVMGQWSKLACNVYLLDNLHKKYICIDLNNKYDEKDKIEVKDMRLLQSTEFYKKQYLSNEIAINALIKLDDSLCHAPNKDTLYTVIEWLKFFW